MAVEMSPERFEELVADALDTIPRRFMAEMSNVVVLVEDIDPENHNLLGLYHGVALTRRTSYYSGVLPDRITIYRHAIEAICQSEAEVAEQVRRTVIHEVAHHFGLSDARLRELGW